MKYLSAHKFLIASVGVLAALSFSTKSTLAATIPNQPLSAETGPKPGQVTLKWSHIYSDVQNYNVVFGTEPGNYQYGAVGVGKTTSYTINYLKPGVKYYFAISPVKGGKAQFISNAVSAVSEAGVVTPPPVQPAASTDVVAASPQDRNFKAEAGDRPGQVKLSWKRVDGEDGYHVVYGTKPGQYQYSALNVGKAGSFTVSILKPGEKYYFALIPLKGGTPQPKTSEVESLPKPGVVENPVATNTQSNQTTQTSSIQGGVGAHQLSISKGGKSGSVNLNWKQVDGEDNYHIVYGTKPGKFEYGALNVGKNGSYTVNDLKSGQTYYFAIVPVKGGKAQYISQETVSSSPSNGGGGSSQSNGGGSSGGGGNSSGGSSSAGSSGSGSSSTGTTTTNTGSQTTTSGGGSTSTGTTTTTTTDSKKNENNKKVKGASTSRPVTIWELIMSFFSSRQ